MKKNLLSIFLGTHLRSFFFLLMLLSSVGCMATPPLRQPQVSSLINAQRPEKAIEAMTEDDESYGDQNVLLYWLDRGLAYHLAGDYQQSIHAFAQAQRTFDNLYTQSLTKKFGTLLVNDYFQDYRGEDYEYVLVNLFQALNYVLQGNAGEALVEARKFNQRMRVLQQIYEGKDHIYQDDAFVRLMMGLFYETVGGSLNLNDAFIEYQKAVLAYDAFYQEQSDLVMPNILKENVLALAKHFSPRDFESFRKRWPDINFLSLSQRQDMAQIIVLEYAGFSPVKVPASLVLPVEKDAFVSVSLPKMYHRYSENDFTEVFISGDHFGEQSQLMWVGHDLTPLAKQVREKKKVWLTTKSIIRPIAKYLLQREARHQAEKEYGQTMGQIVNVLMNAYNIYSEQADLRSWQTLPNQIRVAQFWVQPDEYHTKVNVYDEEGGLLDSHFFNNINLKPGDTKWIVFRTYH